MAILNGSEFPDEIIGSNDEEDTINGLGGNDILHGGKGNFTDDNKDEINGGDGNDEIYGYGKQDTLNGGAGEDKIYGGWDPDIIDGGTGNDFIDGGSEADYILGGDGDDVVEGNFGDDEIYGGNGKDTLDGYSGRDSIYGGAGNDTIDGSMDNDFLYGETGDDIIDGGLGDDTIDGGAGNDIIDGESGDDTAVFSFAFADTQQLKRNYQGVLKLTSASGVDTISNVETLKFSDQSIDSESLVNFFPNIDDELIIGTEGADSIKGGAGDDTIHGKGSGDVVDGGDGEDTVVFDFGRSDVINISQQANIVSIFGPEGFEYLANIEKLVFSDSSTSMTVQEALSLTGDTNVEAPTNNDVSFTKVDANGSSVQVAPATYSGAVSFLDYEFFGESEGDIVTGSESNDFINLLGGDDAANGGDGQDVLDGGTGSNFLTGGNGADTFFLDGRGGSTTWSTITDFNGDSVNIWGWNDGVSQLVLTQENAGASGFVGATFHYDLNNDGTIDTSITFSGLSTNQVPTSSAQEVADNGYLLFA